MLRTNSEGKGRQLFSPRRPKGPRPTRPSRSSLKLPPGKEKDPDHALIAMTVDRSGSMISMGNEVVGGCNAFLEEQRSSTEKTSMIFTTFDDRIEVLYEGDLEAAPPVTAEDVRPRGMTALHDAIGDLLQRVIQRLSALEKEPSCILIFILTDGAENSSNLWAASDVAREIERLKAPPYNWSFTFAGANQDALLEGSKYGIAKGDCVTFGDSPAGFGGVMRSVSHATTRARHTEPTYRSAAKAFTPAERNTSPTLGESSSPPGAYGFWRTRPARWPSPYARLPSSCGGQRDPSAF